MYHASKRITNLNWVGTRKEPQRQEKGKVKSGMTKGTLRHGVSVDFRGSAFQVSSASLCADQVTHLDNGLGSPTLAYEYGFVPWQLKSVTSNSGPWNSTPS